MGSGDVELHSAAVAGDRRRTDELIRRVWPILVRYCRARVGSRSGSWDYADAVARRAGMAMPREYGPRYATRPFREFVYAVADRELASVKPSQEGVMSGAALNRVPVNERIVLILRVIEGMSVGETATEMGLAAERVRLMQHRALAHLNLQVA